MEETGLEVKIDGVGNIFGVEKRTNPGKKIGDFWIPFRYRK